MSFFDDFLATNKVDEADRAVLAKYPGLREQVEQLQARDSDWTRWRNENWDPQANATKAERVLREQLAATQARLTAIPTGTDEEEFVKLRKEVDDKVKAIEQSSLNAVNGMHVLYRAVQTRLLPHEKEFGEVLDGQKLIDFMTAQKINDPEIAYDRMMAPRRAELATQKQKEQDTKHAADIEAARQEGYQKRQQEEAMGPQGSLPTDNTGGIAGITAQVAQPAKLSEETAKAVSDAKLGTGELARLGYEAYRRGDFHSAA